MNEKNINIQISSNSIIKVIFWLTLFAGLYYLKDLVLVVLTAVVIASAIDPAVKWFGRFRVSRVPAVILVYFLVATVFIGIFYVFIPVLFDELSKLADFFPQYIKVFQSISPVNLNQINLSGAQEVASGISQNISLVEDISNLKSSLIDVPGGLFNAISGIFGGVLSFILVVVISFYFSVQERGIEEFLRIITPVQSEKYVVDLWKRSQAKIGKWIQGQLLLGVLVGVLVFLGLSILGVKYALVLALLAAIFEIIPVFGPILAATPAVIFGFLDSVTLGLTVLGFYVIIQQFENHLIYPLVVRKIIGVPPILVILSLIVGAKLAGFLGIILAVPVATLLVEIADDISRRKTLQESAAK